MGLIIKALIFLIFCTTCTFSDKIDSTKDGLQQEEATRRPLPWWLMMDRYKTIGIPNPTQLFPNSGKACIPIDGTVGEDNGQENAFWYFREDLLVNAQHIFWHLTHPIMLDNPNGTLTNDRRGELFYYFHRNVLARYDAERLAKGFNRVVALRYEEGAIVGQGYDPHFQEGTTEFTYPPRPSNMPFINITRFTRLWQTVYADINNRMLIARDGRFVALDDLKGIDYLGELIEASINNINEDRYSFEGIHNAGHGHIGSMFNEGGNFTARGVMLNPSTSMRDPVFYQWHKLVDDIFYRHHSYMAPNHPTVGQFPLLWQGVSVESISVRAASSESPNLLQTFFKNLTISIPIKQDIFMSNETIEYCMKRLEYDEFTYNITIEKQPSVNSEKATVRVFMAPRFNEVGQRFSLDEQTRQFFAMDSFVVHLNYGKTVVTRNSSSSNLNLNWKLENWMDSPPSYEQPECGCGWPSNLLLPTGNAQGMVFDLFVMVTNAEIDTPENLNLMQEPQCKMSTILCGIKDQKYPDIRPMGYPFDTKPFQVSVPGGPRMVANLEEYVSLLPNTKATQVTIRHS